MICSEGKSLSAEEGVLGANIIRHQYQEIYCVAAVSPAPEEINCRRCGLLLTANEFDRHSLTGESARKDAITGDRADPSAFIYHLHICQLNGSISPTVQVESRAPLFQN
jgi:hypothetical protein